MWGCCDQPGGESSSCGPYTVTSQMLLTRTSLSSAGDSINQSSAAIRSDRCECHDGSSAVSGYSSCRWNHDTSPSLRPSGARSSHCHIVHSPSKPRAYAEYVRNTSSQSSANALMPGCSPDQSRQATFSASSCAWSL